MNKIFDTKYFENKRTICYEVLAEVDFVRKFLTGKTVLDVACGTGRHGYLLQFYGYDVTYLDVSEDALNTIWWTKNKVCGDFLAYTGEKVDNVVSFHFIEHLSDNDLTTALKKMKELARYRIINVTPHPKHVEYKKDPTHVSRSYKDLVKLYFKILPDTKIYAFDNKFRGNAKAWVKGFLEKLRPHYFENLVFVTKPQ